MRLELRDKPEEKREPVVKLWLNEARDGNIVLSYQVDDDPEDSIAYFNIIEKRFHVFNKDVMDIGYRFTSTYPSEKD